ncbi:hypothetical protein K4K58_003928 [Colletotrichum sp. SAR11_239]|nr:hypothetical protein K4K58_003928 [Colletotrichum sp. SAR11_239]
MLGLISSMASYAALGLDYDPKVAHGMHKLWTSLELAHNDPAASYLIVLKDVVSSDAQKMRTLVKVAKALNINIAKELGMKDLEDSRALRPLCKEDKTIDATELRKLREEQRITQAAQNIKEEGEYREFVDPSNSSRHASA